MVYVCDSGTWCSSDTWLYRTWRQSNREPSRKCETPCVTFRGQQDCLRPAHLIETLSSWWGHLAVAFRTRRPLLLAALPVQRVSHLTVDSGLTPTSLTGTTHYCSTTYSVFFCFICYYIRWKLAISSPRSAHFNFIFILICGPAVAYHSFTLSSFIRERITIAFPL